MSQSIQYDSNRKKYVLYSTTAQYEVIPDDYINPIAKGSFGIVYKGILPQSKCMCAIKQIKKSGLDISRIKLEYEVMKSISDKKCDHLISAFDFADDDFNFYIIMPLFDLGNLTSFINKAIINSEQEAIEYFRQICYGMMNLHQMGIIHRDLKTDNIFVSSYSDNSYPYKFYFVVGDLGLSKTFSAEAALTMNVGTAFTKAPEVLSGAYDFKADVYSLGCILFKMLTGKEPFIGYNEQEINVNKKREKMTVKSAFSQPLSSFSIGILEDCLQYNAKNRMPNSCLYKLLKVQEIYGNAKYESINLGEISSRQYINLNKNENERKYLMSNIEQVVNSKQGNIKLK
jgi:serine/threonine protein kinase